MATDNKKNATIAGQPPPMNGSVRESVSIGDSQRPRRCDVGCLTIAVAGFGPFPRVPDNPSAELLRLIQRDAFPGIHVQTSALPVCPARARRGVKQIIESGPDVLLMFGADPTNHWHINIEHTARNAWQQDPSDSIEEITPGGSVSYPAMFPCAECVQDLNAGGMPCSLSDNAGTYVCNLTFYTAAEIIAREGLPVLFGFIHLPAGTYRPLLHGMKDTIQHNELLMTIFTTIVERAIVAWHHSLGNTETCDSKSIVVLRQPGMTMER